MRPPLIETIPLSREEATRRLREELNTASCPCTGAVSSGHVSVAIREEQRQFFSPSLDLHLYDDPAGARLDGHFGPHPDVWTLYVAVYATLGAVSIGVTMWSASQWMIGGSTATLLALPGLLVLAGLVYLSALIGQRLAADQMTLIDGFLHGTLGLTKPGSTTEGSRGA